MSPVSNSERDQTDPPEVHLGLNKWIPFIKVSITFNDVINYT